MFNFKKQYSDEKETQWQKLTFADKIELARKFSCFEAYDLRDNDNRYGWKYFRKGAQRGLRIANIHDTDINHILDLVHAMIFVPDEMKLAEQSSSYWEWQDRIEATYSE